MASITLWEFTLHIPAASQRETQTFLTVCWEQKEYLYVPKLVSALKMRNNIGLKYWPKIRTARYFESPWAHSNASDKGPLPSWLLSVVHCQLGQNDMWCRHRKSFVSLYSAINLQRLSQQRRANRSDWQWGIWGWGSLGVGGKITTGTSCAGHLEVIYSNNRFQ